MRWLFNLYPPLLGAGVHVRYVAPDWRQVEVSMPLRWYNRNYVGTQFGGSLFAMCDPFLMIMLSQILGRDYLVWDQRAAIDFVRPGRSRVYASLRIDDAAIDTIRANTADGGRYLHQAAVDVTDADGEIVAQVTKVIYVRLKPALRPGARDGEPA